MPLIDVRCSKNPNHTHEVHRPLAQWPATPPCLDCGAATIQVHLPKAASYVDPIIVYQAPDGSLRFPGARNGRTVAGYESAGYRRMEIRGAADMRRFESSMNARESSIMARKLEQKLAAREQRESVNRSDLRGRMQSMTTMGRDVARAAMRHNDNKPRERTADPGFHSEVYSNDRSSREISRDSQGRRHRD